MAVHFYEQALDEPPVAEGTNYGPRDGFEGSEQDPPFGACDLRREAAHNLALIHRASGADELARAVLRKHLTV